ncbi:MAG: 2-hydroxychromene-2-carboxylate isomerase [Betaproteobacteria bacterium]|nr:2-hydroxychromene-2-carboxylate isomerase [Betaproteobacteria bacterium]
MSKHPIEFYFDFISPYGYFGSTQIEAIAARHGRTVDWRPVLIGVTIMKVMGLKALTETPLKKDYLRHDAPRMARLLGVPFQFNVRRGGNSLAASRAFLWLKSRDPELAKRFAHGIYARRWAEGRDITDPQSVAEVAVPLGVNRDDLLAAIASQQVKQNLKDAVDSAMAKGVFGVPYFIVDNEPVWGSDRLWMLEHWLQYGSWDAVQSRQSGPK